MSVFEQSRSILNDGNSFGVWSVIITFFGDMAQDHDARVAGSTLTQLCELMEIKPEAMRVALHRLRKDGWIDSEKHGRRSDYFLTDTSRSESAEASKHIYSVAGVPNLGMKVMIAPPYAVDRINRQEWTTISDAVFLSFSEAPTLVSDAVVMPINGPLPNWISTLLIPKPTCDEYRRFHEQLISVKPDQWHTLKSHEIAVLRVLIVHNWRRLLLKHPALPDAAFPENCPISECRAKVLELLGKLPRPNLDALA